jgi:hypothetical protein
VERSHTAELADLLRAADDLQAGSRLDEDLQEALAAGSSAGGARPKATLIDGDRNHAAFWDGDRLELTPAYDICPQPRAGQEQAQAMAIGPEAGRLAQLTTCVAAAHLYDLTVADARAIIDHQLQVVHEQFDDAADMALLTAAQRRALLGRQILNPFATYGYDTGT